MAGTTVRTESCLALLGGPRTVIDDPGDMFDWPIVTREDEEAVLDVLRRGAMSGSDVTVKFEEEFARWQGADYALAFNNGTSAIHAAMFGCGISVGDEVICPSVTYWGSVLQCFSLGATVLFAEIDPDSLCLDPGDIERHITSRTKAIVVVHYLGHPADMDAIMEIARRHDLKVIEDVSHAQGGMYKGQKVGTFGDVAAMSLMSGKSFAIGEAGILTTNDREIYERAIAFGHYERFDERVQSEELRIFRNLPLGGHKYRIHQMSSAVGRVQLRHYDERCAEIRKAMNYFWDLLEGVPGIKAHRPSDPGSNMAGWYAPHGLYRPEELGGLSVTGFIEAVKAEGVDYCRAGCNSALHLHPVFSVCDIYGHGQPTRYAHSDRLIRQPSGSLPISEGIGARTYGIPWFKHYRPETIERYADAFRKVAQNYEDLLPDHKGNPPHLGSWHFYSP